MEVGPTLHYFMGGIRVNNDTQQTNVLGLFACGECAGGMHGANRLGGNSLSDLLVFGKLAGDGAIHYVKNHNEMLTCKNEDISKIMRNATDMLNRNEGHNPYIVHEELQNIMQNNVGIVRTGDELQNGLEKLAEIKVEIDKVSAHASAQYNPGWNEALDLQNLIITSEAVTRSAILREESRGAHTRLDFEGEREEGLEYNIVIKKTDQGMLAEKIKRESPSQELADIAYASLSELEGEDLGA
jgi:succinate dehydrogenase / fumarate reductase flavoprotein subunit